MGIKLKWYFGIKRMNKKKKYDMQKSFGLLQLL